VNLSVEEAFVQRLGHGVFVCRRLQGFNRSAKKLFAQSNRGSLIGFHNMHTAMRITPAPPGDKLIGAFKLASAFPLFNRIGDSSRFYVWTNRGERPQFVAPPIRIPP
jgi:hypothetical protein